MIRDSRLVVGVALYVVVARAVLRLPPAARAPAFAVVNVAATAVFFYAGSSAAERVLFGVYVAFMGVQWGLTRVLALRRGASPWIAFLVPIGVLVALKYVPSALSPAWRALDLPADGHAAGAAFVGLSYMAFRLSYLVLEVRNGAAKMPSLCRYLAFAFFPATMAVGPINPYAVHDASFDAPDRQATPLGTSALRIVVGFTKYLYLGTLCDQLSYAGLELDRRPHPPIDGVVAGVFYYLYLYCNFSGFCDVGIGMAGAIGIRVRENFDHPFAARSVRDFWNRWHITLSTYMRDVVFTPLSKWLASMLGPGNTNHAVAIAVFTVFVLVGVWHGAGLNFLVFGVLHAIAVVTNHYYGIVLRKVLGKERLRAYQKSRVIQALAVALTFSYVAFTLFFFANRDSVVRVVAALRGAP